MASIDAANDAEKSHGLSLVSFPGRRRYLPLRRSTLPALAWPHDHEHDRPAQVVIQPESAERSGLGQTLSTAHPICRPTRSSRKGREATASAKPNEEDSLG